MSTTVVDEQMTKRYYAAIAKRDARYEDLYGEPARELVRDLLRTDCTPDYVVHVSRRRERCRLAHRLWCERCNVLQDAIVALLPPPVPTAGDAVRLTDQETE